MFSLDFVHYQLLYLALSKEKVETTILVEFGHRFGISANIRIG